MTVSIFFSELMARLCLTRIRRHAGGALPPPLAGKGWGEGNQEQSFELTPSRRFAPTSPGIRAFTPVFDGLCGGGWHRRVIH